VNLEEKASAGVWEPGEVFTALQRLRARRRQLAAEAAELSRRVDELGQRVQVHLTQLAG
jgi:hypothetical protein